MGREGDNRELNDLVQRLRGEHGTEPWQINPAAKIAADAIEFLQRELKCSEELWEQQKELALEYLADIEKANERIVELEAAFREIYEVYAGSDGFIPETCAEGYQQQLIKEMSDIAAKHMRKGVKE